jgi:SulP family sulfate permease
LKRHGKWLVLCGVQPQPLRVMERSGLLDKLGRENVCPDVDSALARAREILSSAATERIRAAGAHG